MQRLLTLFATLFLSFGAMAQHQAADTPLYIKNPSLPPFNILSADSTQVFNTYNIKPGKPTVFIYFSPECDHCQQALRELREKADSLKDATVYLTSFVPLYEMNKFIVEYKLHELPNWRFGKDYQYFFPTYFGARSVPFMAVYDKNKKLVAGRDGGFKATELFQLVKQKSSF